MGACFAKPDKRVVVLCGDGAFQMTGNELSTLCAQQILADPDHPGQSRLWHRTLLARRRLEVQRDLAMELSSPCQSCMVPAKVTSSNTEGEFLAALESAWNDRTQVHVIHAKLVEGDASKTLLRLAERLGAKVSGK